MEKQLYEVSLTCVQYSRNGNESYVIKSPYYVVAENPKQAIEIVATWLPRNLDIDDVSSCHAEPYELNKPSPIVSTAGEYQQQIYRAALRQPTELYDGWELTASRKSKQ